MKKILTPLFFMFLFSENMNAQVTSEVLDINNVSAKFLTHGDMFWDPTTATSAYEFPKGSGKYSNFAAALWISGFDSTANELKVSAQTYRQKGNDYWSGPLENNGNITSTVSNDWDKIWKINLSDITTFNNITTHTLSNTPTSILEWPAKGNLYAKGKANVALNITKDMAPFIDINNDGIYNPLDGDYPKIKGEQALWWVFNDQLTHGNSGGTPLGMEIKAIAYACNSPEVQNMIFVNFSMNYYGQNTIYHTRFSIFDDIDLGYGLDDYIGVDTTRRMGISYNSNSNDNIYGSQLTQTGCIILKTPGDIGNIKEPLGAFTFFTNGAANGGDDPNLPNEYYNYMQGKWTNNTNIPNTCAGFDSTLPTINYVYPSDPSDTNGFSEKNCNNFPSDRRFVLSTGDITLTSGMSDIQFDFAIINTPLGSSNDNYYLIKSMADTAILYQNGCNPGTPNLVNNITKNNLFSISPNPANSSIVVTYNNSNYQKETIEIFNTLGQKIFSSKMTAQKMTINTESLSNGIYLLKANQYSEKLIISK